VCDPSIVWPFRTNIDGCPALSGSADRALMDCAGAGATGAQ
jgi:hypothetical protein